MAKKTSAKHGTTHASKTTGKTAGKLAGKALARRGPAKHSAKNITDDIRTLASEVKDLRTLRSKYDQLVAEHNGLLGSLRELTSALAGSAREAWNDYRGGKPVHFGAARPRIRAASADVDAMTSKLNASLPTAWSTKEQICKAAGLDPKAANSAFRRLVLGYIRGGKKVAASLESNGKRGVEGRYRKR